MRPLSELSDEELIALHKQAQQEEAQAKQQTASNDLSSLSDEELIALHKEASQPLEGEYIPAKKSEPFFNDARKKRIKERLKKELTGEAMWGSPEDVRSAAIGAAQALTDFGTGVYNLVTGKEDADKVNIDISKYAGGKPKSKGAAMVGSLGASASFPIVRAGKVINALPLLSKAKFLPQIADSIATAGVTNAVLNANNPRSNALKDLMFGGGTGAAVDLVSRIPGAGKAIIPAGVAGAMIAPELGIDPAVGAGGSAAIAATAAAAKRAPTTYIESLARKYRKEAAKPGSHLRSPEEVAQINEVIGDSPVSFGEVINDNPLIKSYQDNLRLFPFSKVKDKSNQTIADANKVASDFAQELTQGLDPSEIDALLQNELIKTKDITRKQKNKNYDDFYNVADMTGFSLKGLPSTQKVALRELEKITRSTAAGSFRKLSEDDLDILATILGNKELLQDKTWNVLKRNFSKDEAEKIRRKLKQNFPETPIAQDAETAFENVKILGKKAFQAAEKGETTTTLYNDLKDAYLNDIEHHVKKSGNKDLLELLNNANKFYQEDYLPFKNPTIRNAINRTGTPDNITNALLRGENEKILEKMSPEAKRMIAASKFRKVLDEDFAGDINATPAAIKRAYETLTPKQQRNLFTKEQRQKIKEIGMWGDVTKAARLKNNPPPTGVQLKDIAKYFAVLATGTGGKVFFPQSTMIAAPLFAAYGPAKAALLRSKKLRENYAKGIKEEKDINRNALNKWMNSLIYLNNKE